MPVQLFLFYAAVILKHAYAQVHDRKTGYSQIGCLIIVPINEAEVPEIMLEVSVDKKLTESPEP